MSASLVGSEMCIRDSETRELARGVLSLNCAAPEATSKLVSDTPEGCLPVSYTHLTLPTICSV
eukprot:8828982-Alexandrium_andersonii.AAC.1